jgi:RepB DNA-primase from phage plasmid
MGDDGTEIGHIEAEAMLEAFASVGATCFDLTWTTRAGAKEFFCRGLSLAELSRTLPAMLDAAIAKQQNLIVRPHGDGVTFIQLDDLKAGQLSRIAPAVFLALQTSPGNFQAWVAMSDAEDKDFTRRLRKGMGADPTASGATRVAGSLNFKDKYAPDFPRVAIRAANFGRLAHAAALERLGAVAEPEAAQPLRRITPARARPTGSNRKWPSYARCMEGAPPSQSRPGKTRDSMADFTWCLIAADWGWSVDEIAQRLLEESAKARDNGERYALQTAARAAEAVERRKQQPKRASGLAVR